MIFFYTIKHQVRFSFLLVLHQVFVTAGLGGMSGAQPKAGVICGCVAVVAEVIFFKEFL